MDNTEMAMPEPRPMLMDIARHQEVLLQAHAGKGHWAEMHSADLVLGAFKNLGRAVEEMQNPNANGLLLLDHLANAGNYIAMCYDNIMTALAMIDESESNSQDHE